ncbi:MAG: VanZ family protein [Oscillospiraceae bacterium]|nr:VanZ family protein [Oscillospiraceae bacterium]
MKKTKLRLALNIGFLCAVLAFIWGNSLMPGEDSGALSGWVGNFLNTLLPFLRLDTEEGMHFLRKAAHFSEFAALGFGFGWLFGMLFQTWLPRLGLPLVCGVAAAGIDEFIQRFSPGRYCSIKDVGIDSLGVITGIAVITCGYLLIRWIKRKK